jgi:hypothetical protein
MQMKQFLIVAAFLIAFVAPASTQDFHPPAFLRATFALDSAENCRVPNKLYQVSIQPNHEVEFRNVGTYKLDVQIWDFEDKARGLVGLHTTHSDSGEPDGTQWVYEFIDNSVIRVWRNGTFFHLGIKCE